MVKVVPAIIVTLTMYVLVSEIRHAIYITTLLFISSGKPVYQLREACLSAQGSLFISSGKPSEFHLDAR